MAQYIDQITKLLHLQAFDQHQNLQFVQKKIGVKPSALVIAILVFLIIVTLISNATSIVIAVGCFCIPAYFTLITMQNQNWSQTKKYIIYWILYIILQIISPFLLLIFSSTLYIIIRIAIAVALLHPESPLVQKLYQDIISPLMKSHQRSVQDDINRVLNTGKGIFQEGKQFSSKKWYKPI